jgi:hypothetical protein
MKNQISSQFIRAAVVILAIFVVQPIFGKPGNVDVRGKVTSTRGETTPLITAQYNPCPNGKCR